MKQHTLLWPVLQAVRRPVAALTAIHQRHGELVSARFFNQKLLFVSHPDHIEEVFNQEAKGLLSRDFLYQAKESLFGDGLVNSKSEVWSKQRRILQPLFSKDSVLAWETMMAEEALSAALQLAKDGANAQQVNLTGSLKKLVQSVFIKILTGKSINEIRNREALVEAIDTISAGLLPQLVTQIISHGRLMRLLPYKHKRYQKAVGLLKTFVNQEIMVNSPGPNLISLFIRAKDKNTGYVMSPALMQDEVVNLFFAGQDTTINALLWFFYLIGRDDNVHHKITEEINQYRDEPVTAEHLANLNYTRAALHETLRLYPPTPALATQAISDIEIGNQSIAKGTAVILSLYVTHRDRAHWERPDAFYPGHFFNKNSGDRPKYSYYPFGGGLHNCIGRHFAELEMLVIIVTLLRQFSFKTNCKVKEASGITLKPDKPITGLITSRPEFRHEYSDSND